MGVDLDDFSGGSCMQGCGWGSEKVGTRPRFMFRAVGGAICEMGSGGWEPDGRCIQSSL